MMKDPRSVALLCKVAAGAVVILIVIMLLLAEIHVSEENQVFLLTCLCIAMF